MLKQTCNKFPFWGGVTVLLSVTFLPSQLTYAQEIVPEPSTRAEVKLQTGWVDAITKTDIVIDDLVSPLSGVTVVDQNGVAVAVSALTVGRYVAFNRSGEKTEIHLLTEQEKRPGLPGDNNSPQKSESAKESIRQVDGVWKN